MGKRQKAGVCISGSKANFAGSESWLFSCFDYSTDLPRSVRVFAVTRRPDVWVLLEHSRILLLKAEVRRLREKLDTIRSVLNGGRYD